MKRILSKWKHLFVVEVFCLFVFLLFMLLRRSENEATWQFTAPLALRHNSLYNPTGMHFFPFYIVCIMHRNTDHIGSFFSSFLLNCKLEMFE